MPLQLYSKGQNHIQPVVLDQTKDDPMWFITYLSKIKYKRNQALVEVQNGIYWKIKGNFIPQTNSNNALPTRTGGRTKLWKDHSSHEDSQKTDLGALPAMEPNSWVEHRGTPECCFLDRSRSMLQQPSDHSCSVVSQSLDPMTVTSRFTEGISGNSLMPTSPPPILFPLLH